MTSEIKQEQTKPEKKKLTKAEKQLRRAARRKVAGNRMNTVTLVFQIILTVGLMTVAFAPMLSTVFGVTLFLFIAVAAVVLSAITVFIIWTDAGVRSAFAKMWNFMGECFKGPDKIIATLKPYIVYISIAVFVASSVGFIYNIVYYFKHEKANKKRFITSCVFLGLAAVFMACAMIVYLTAN